MRTLKWILLIGLINSASGQVDTSFLDKTKTIVVTDTVYGEDTLYFQVLSNLLIASKLVRKYAKAEIELSQRGSWYQGKIGKRIVGDFYVLKNKVGYFEIYGKGYYKLGLKIKGVAVAKLYYQEIGDSLIVCQAKFYFYTDNVLAKSILFIKPSLLPREAQKIMQYIKIIGRELIFNPTARRLVLSPP